MKPQRPKAETRLKILEYLANPDNEDLGRVSLSVHLGYSEHSAMYQIFPAAELDEIYREALEMRRKRYASLLMAADQGLMKKAASGDSQAVKLAYQKFEGWSEKNVHEHGITPELFELIMAAIGPEAAEKVRKALLSGGKK